jgi:hypothetical protein
MGAPIPRLLSLKRPSVSDKVRRRHRPVGGLILAVALAATSLVGPFAGLASADPAAPVITFTSPPSPAAEAMVTTNSVSFTFVYDHKPNQTTSVTCALAGQTSFSPAPCSAVTEVDTGSQSANNTYSSLANGSYTFTVSVVLKDHAQASATVPFTVNAPYGPGGCLVTDTTTQTGYSSLQQANNASQNGDTLTVQGTCTGPTTITQDNLTIDGVGQNPTLDGNQAGSVLTFDPNLTYTVNGLTIQNGLAAFGGGVDVQANSNATFNNDNVINNTAEWAGGGFYLDPDSAVNLASDTVSSNTAPAGAGIAIVNAYAVMMNDKVTLNCPSGTTPNSSSGTCEDIIDMSAGTQKLSTMADSTVGSVVEDGGTSLTTDSTDLVEGSVVVWTTGCVIDEQSGFAYPTLQLAEDSAVPGDVLQLGGTPTEQTSTATCEGQTTFTKAVIVQGPGTLDGQGTTTPVIVGGGEGTPYFAVAMIDLTITNGQASTGGGIQNFDGLILGDVTVTGNNASAAGGGIYNAPTGAIDLGNGTTITDNTAGFDGGGILNEGGVTDGSTDGSSNISDNSAESGGGIYNAGTFNMVDAAIVDNNTATDGGGGIFNDGILTLYDQCTVIGNSVTAPDGEGGGILNTDIATLTYEDNTNVVDGNTPNNVYPD